MAEDKDTAGTVPEGAPVLNGTLAPLIPALFTTLLLPSWQKTDQVFPL